MKTKKRLLFLVSSIVFATLLFFGGHFDAGAAGECVMFPNSTWNGTQCVCDSGFFDTRCGQDPYAINCQSLGLCDGTWKGSCLSGETPSTSYGKKCEGTAEEKVCCVSSTPSPGAPGAPVTPSPGAPGSPTKCDTSKFKEVGGVCFPINTGLSEASITDILRNLLMWILGVFGFLAIMAFIISGIQYLISAGDEKALETAKRNMKWAIVGVVVALSGFVIILAVTAALKAITSTF